MRQEDTKAQVNQGFRKAVSSQRGESLVVRIRVALLRAALSAARVRGWSRENEHTLLPTPLVWCSRIVPPRHRRVITVGWHQSTLCLLSLGATGARLTDDRLRQLAALAPAKGRCSMFIVHLAPVVLHQTDSFLNFNCLLIHLPLAFRNTIQHMSGVGEL